MLGIRLLRRARPPLRPARAFTVTAAARSRPQDAAPTPDPPAPTPAPTAEHRFALPDEKRAGPHSRTADDDASAHTRPVPRVRDPVRGPSGPVDLGAEAAAAAAAAVAGNVPETGPFSRPHFEASPGLSVPREAEAVPGAAQTEAQAATMPFSAGSADASPATTPAPAAPDPLQAVPRATYHPRVPRHPFNTHAFVATLERAAVPAPNARVLMEGVRGLITARTQRAVDTQLSVEEMDNNAYLFKAALSELRTEASTRARQDGLKLRDVANAIRREVDGLDQKIKEDVLTMKHDIEIEVNNRKAETTAELKRFDIAVEEINHKFTISLGELRTDIESSKWDATRRAIAVIITLVMFGVVMSTVTMAPAKAEDKAPHAPLKDAAVGPDEHHDDHAHHDDAHHPVLPHVIDSRVDQLLKDRAVLDRDVLAGKALAARKEKEAGRI
ncbi:hypothetical protein Q8F55_001434 [Vanrija albida]|uniref:Mitochondrial protein n=1 Tax=Vanrija albida TaxID=181172 RepID=A0ABR3QH16_9TREE